MIFFININRSKFSSDYGLHSSIIFSFMLLLFLITIAGKNPFFNYIDANIRYQSHIRKPSIYLSDKYERCDYDKFIRLYNCLDKENLKAYKSWNTIESNAFKKTVRLTKYDIKINDIYYIMSNRIDFIKYDRFIRREVNTMHKKIINEFTD